MGHPDYQSYASWRSAPIEAQSVTVTSIAPVTVAGIITNFASVYLGVTAPANGVTIAVTFWDSAAMNTQFATLGFTIIGTTQLNVIIPATGGYVTATISTSQAGNQTVTVTLEGTNQAPSRPVYLGQENRVAALAQSIALSATITTRLPAIMEGSGYIYFRDTTGSGKLNVRVRRLNEAAAEVDDIVAIFGSLAAVTLAFNAPPRPVDISIFNTDAAAAHTYDMSCQIISAAA